MTIAIVITSYGNWSEEHSTKFLKEDSETKGQFGQQESMEIVELSKPGVLRAI